MSKNTSAGKNRDSLQCTKVSSKSKIIVLLPKYYNKCLIILYIIRFVLHIE